jgi:hypothetical protein
MQCDETMKEEDDFGGEVYADPSQVHSVQKTTIHHGGKMTKPTDKATADTKLCI